MITIKKTIFVLNVDNYNPMITSLTYPLMKTWALKIGANFHEIKTRKFPTFPVAYEKLQIYELGKDMKNDWNIYIDADALVHPDLFDITNHLSKDTVLHNRNDLSGNRWKYDEYFMRDGRYISSCNWFTIASDWCLDLWKPLDMTCEEAVNNIYPVKLELNAGITRHHLIDDYTLSRNIARFGLKFKSLATIQQELGQKDFNYLYHQYLMPEREKVKQICFTIRNWGFLDTYEKNLRDDIINITSIRPL